MNFVVDLSRERERDPAYGDSPRRNRSLKQPAGLPAFQLLSKKAERVLFKKNGGEQRFVTSATSTSMGSSQTDARERRKEKKNINVIQVADIKFSGIPG